MSRRFRHVTAAGVLGLMLCAPTRVRAYSVLSHESNVDAVWDDAIVPVLLQQYPSTSAEELREARAYAYGGCVIQDLGYYPFGSHFFSNLLHYVRTGDFVTNLIAQAHDVNELAFALGALSHYAADNDGHPIAVNRSVPLVYPKLRRKYGNRVTYAESPKAHVLVEFSFDVVQVATGAYASEAYHKFIGFKVANDALARAVRSTYGLELKDLFTDVDLAIGTYRHAVSSIIPEMTKVAWRDKRDEILKVAPAMQESAFVFHISPQEYDAEFDGDYEKPKWWARLFGVLFKLLPKIGPFRPLAFKVPTPEAEQLFIESLAATRDRFRQSLMEVRDGHLQLDNRNLDTGAETRRGAYNLADKTYVKLVKKLDHDRCEAVPAELAADIDRFFSEGLLSSKLRRELAEVRASANTSSTECDDHGGVR